jgi:voltage-gated potassium channel Kch
MSRPLFIPPFLIVLVALLALTWWGQQVPYLLTTTPMSEDDVLHSETGGDFRVFWAAGRIVATGDPRKVYDRTEIAKQDTFRELRPDQGVAQSLFYPPIVLPALAWLGDKPFPEAWLIYEGASLLVLAVAVVLAFPRQVWALPVAAGFGGLWLALDFGQNTVLLTALYLLALACLPLKEVRLGAVLALASFKPHLGLVIPLWLILRRSWIAILTTSVFVAALVGFSVFAYGPEIWGDYIASLRAASDRLADFKVVRPSVMISTYAAVRQFGFDHVEALVAQGGVAVLALWGLVTCARQSVDPQKPLAAALLTALLIVPHGYAYDLVLLLVPVLVMLKKVDEHGWELRDAEVILPLYLAPFYVPQLNLGTGLPVVPLLLLWALYHLVQLSKRQD